MRAFFVFCFLFLFLFSFVYSERTSEAETSFFIEPESGIVDEKVIQDSNSLFDFFFLGLVVVMIAVVLYFLVKGVEKKKIESKVKVKRDNINKKKE